MADFETILDKRGEVVLRLSDTLQGLPADTPMEIEESPEGDVILRGQLDVATQEAPTLRLVGFELQIANRGVRPVGQPKPPNRQVPNIVGIRNSITNTPIEIGEATGISLSYRK